MYLESIFVGSEDIRRQLPQETAMFDAVHQRFTQAMARLRATGNVVQAATAPGVLATFQVRAGGAVALPASACNALRKA
jgi:dynein heavy chain